MLYIGLGALAADTGIQFINNGISITRTVYNFGYNMIFGRPKTDTERIEELTELAKDRDDKIDKLTKQIEDLTNLQRNKFQIRSNLP